MDSERACGVALGSNCVKLSQNDPLHISGELFHKTLAVYPARAHTSHDGKTAQSERTLLINRLSPYTH